MKIILAPDSFKESMTAPQAAAAMARGVSAADPHAVVDICPIADGGDGTVDALVTATDGARQVNAVTGPTGESVDAEWAMLGDRSTAVIEMANAAGLRLMPIDDRDPTHTTTFGVGQLITAALDAGARRIIIGIGGSATNDGGTAMAQALGARFVDRDGRDCPNPLTGGAVGDIHEIDLAARDLRIADTDFVVACDVTNPLTGPDGAAAIYGPQKGATPSQIRQLDANLSHLAGLIDHVDPTLPGAGAAGGLGFGLMAFCNARLSRGIEMVLDAVGFDRRLSGADLVLTGEGQMDGTSVQGKACLGVGQRAAASGVPTIALVGSIGPHAERALDAGLAAYFSICPGPITLADAMADAPSLLEATTANVIRTFANR